MIFKDYIQVSLFAFFIVNFDSFSFVKNASASTTVEEKRFCKYTDKNNEVVFSGKCTVNWGMGGVAGCSKPTNLQERYIVTFSSKSEIEVYFICNGKIWVNGQSAVLN